MFRTIQRQALVGCTVAQMYALVTDIPSYPQFLPWCAGASVLEEKPVSATTTEVLAHLDLAWGPIRYRLVTRNHNEAPSQVAMRLVRGPLDQLEGTWTFAQDPSGATRVALDLRFSLTHRMTAVFVGPLIGEALESLTDAFVNEARRRYRSAQTHAD